MSVEGVDIFYSFIQSILPKIELMDVRLNAQKVLLALFMRVMWSGTQFAEVQPVEAPATTVPWKRVEAVV